MNPKVVIIILNWNGKKVTPRCLETLLSTTNFEDINPNIILIDNGSEDNPENYLKKYEDLVDLILLKENLGFIKGNNYGIDIALKKYDPDYILLLNNDTEIVEKNWLKKLIESCSDEKIGVVGPKLIFPNGKIQWSGRKKEKNPLMLILQTITARANPGFGEHEENAPYAMFNGYVNTISGACMLIKSEFILKNGLLDTDLYPMYQEDVEYSLRTWQKGYKVFYRGDTKLIHHESYGMEINLDNELENKKFFWAMRNSMKVSKKYYGTLNFLIFGIPIYLFVTMFDKKIKDEKLNYMNLKIRKNIWSRFLLFLKALKEH